MILKRPEKGFQLDPETLSLLQVIESTDDDAKRRAAFFRRERIENNRLLRRLQPAARQPLNQPEENQHTE